MQLLRFPSILYFKYRARSATTQVFSRIVALIFLFNCQRWDYTFEKRICKGKYCTKREFGNSIQKLMAVH